MRATPGMRYEPHTGRAQARKRRKKRAPAYGASSRRDRCGHEGIEDSPAAEWFRHVPEIHLVRAVREPPTDPRCSSPAVQNVAQSAIASSRIGRFAWPRRGPGRLEAGCVRSPARPTSYRNRADGSAGGPVREASATKLQSNAPSQRLCARSSPRAHNRWKCAAAASDS
jgi:hypothetical protein